MALSGELWLHAGTTLGRLILSFLMALLPGTALGLAMGWWTTVRIATDPLARLLFPIPSIAFFPVVIFYLGLSELGLLLTAAITPFLVITIQSAAAVESLERTLLEAGRNYGATGWRLFRYVLLPSALPDIFTGMRIGLGLTSVLVVAVELTAAQEGLGAFLWTAGQTLSANNLFSAFLVIGVIGLVLTYGLERAGNRLMPWRERSNAAMFL